MRALKLPPRQLRGLPTLSLAESSADAAKTAPASAPRLVTEARAGYTMPTDALYASLRPNIERALYKVLRERPPDFQDLLQITYERVIRGVRERKFEGRSELKTWASAIAVHVAMDYLRRRSRDRTFFDSIGDIDAFSGRYCRVPLDRLEARSEMRKVQGVLGRMRPRRAAVLVLHDVLGYAAPEIAERLGIGARAVYSTLRRARTELARRCTPTSRVYKD